MKQLRIKIGDIFSVTLDDSSKKYLQYVANDLTQLNSSVIRVFKRKYHREETPDFDEIVEAEVDFYSHVFLRIGVKLGCWQKVGNFPEIGKTEVLFRCTSDLGRPKIKVSEKWYVWKINQPTVRIGKLDAESRNIEMGMVFTPQDIVHRMQTGKYVYDSDYPV